MLQSNSLPARVFLNIRSIAPVECRAIPGLDPVGGTLLSAIDERLGYDVASDRQGPTYSSKPQNVRTILQGFLASICWQFVWPYGFGFRIFIAGRARIRVIPMRSQLFVILRFQTISISTSCFVGYVPLPGLWSDRCTKTVSRSSGGSGLSDATMLHRAYLERGRDFSQAL